jgi:hypothetical protein
MQIVVEYFLRNQVFTCLNGQLGALETPCGVKKPHSSAKNLVSEPRQKVSGSESQRAGAIFTQLSSTLEIGHKSIQRVLFALKLGRSPIILGGFVCKDGQCDWSATREKRYG